MSETKDTVQMDALIEGVMDISAWYGAEGGTLGRLERAKVVVEALAHFAAPALGKIRADRVASALLVTLDDAVVQIRQDDAFCKDVERVLPAGMSVEQMEREFAHQHRTVLFASPADYWHWFQEQKRSAKEPTP